MSVKHMNVNDIIDMEDKAIYDILSTYDKKDLEKFVARHAAENFLIEVGFPYDNVESIVEVLQDPIKLKVIITRMKLRAFK